MAKKIIEKIEVHPDTYRIRCGVCYELFEAGNDDFSYGGFNQLACTCPWCHQENAMSFRKVQKSKIYYGASIVYGE